MSTILGYAWPRGPRVFYEREQVETPDNDFFHVDWLGKNEKGPLLVILHGLEGYSEATYMRRLAALAQHNIKPHTCNATVEPAVAAYA